jgi:hypothetical protein
MQWVNLMPFAALNNTNSCWITRVLQRFSTTMKTDKTVNDNKRDPDSHVTVNNGRLPRTLDIVELRNVRRVIKQHQINSLTFTAKTIFKNMQDEVSGNVPKMKLYNIEKTGVQVSMKRHNYREVSINISYKSVSCQNDNGKKPGLRGLTTSQRSASGNQNQQDNTDGSSPARTAAHNMLKDE